MRKATIKDVAERAGVGVGTVSRVLNGSPHVSPKARASVESAIAGLGFKPDVTARSLRTQRVKNIAFIVGDITNIAFSSIAKGIQQAIDKQGYHLLLFNTGNECVEEKIIAALEERKFDGMIVSVPDERNAELAERFKRETVPIVLLDREISGLRLDAVLSDYRGGIRSAVAFLLELGHRNVGFITSAQTIRPARESLLGYEEAFREAGLVPGAGMVQLGSFAPEFGCEATRRLAEAGATAVVAGSNQLLTGCLEYLREARIGVPERMSVIGFEDSDFARLMNPGITVVRRPLDECGRRIGERMLQRLEAPEDGAEVVSIPIPTELIVRESCGKVEVRP